MEQTTRHRLDPWQVDLCAELTRAVGGQGARLLIHAPPQHGKSIIVSQRLPAWILANDPKHRVKLACYNITHATRFGRIVRDLMAEQYPGDDPRAIPPNASAEEWSTAARRDLHDGQPSFKALGLVTGFVGQGADTLLIDDPYASPQDAYSPVMRESVWTFWNDSARVRITEATNVIVMFHRYHEEDLAGRLMAEDPTKWRLLRYAAREDGDETMPCAPSGRALREKLSPRFSEAWYDDQETRGYTWLGQFQGRPTAKDGLFFKVSQIAFVDAAPAGLRRCRAWDLAATEGAGDYTAGALVEGPDAEGYWYLSHLEYGRWSADRVRATIRQTAELDGKATLIHLPQDPGQAGKDQARQLSTLLAGYAVRSEPVSGPKETRAAGFAAQVNAGNVRMVRGPWNRFALDSMAAFPLGAVDDPVDAMSDGFTELATRRVIRSY